MYQCTSFWYRYEELGSVVVLDWGVNNLKVAWTVLDLYCESNAFMLCSLFSIS